MNLFTISASIVNAVIDSVIFVVNNVVFISCFIGRTIVSGLTAFVASLHAFLFGIIFVLSELFNFGEALITDGIELVLEVVDDFVKTVSSMSHTIAHMELPRVRFIESVVEILCLVRDAVLLIGLGCWNCAAVLLSGLRYLNEAPYIFLLLIARAVDSTIAESYLIVQSVTFKSIVGLTFVVTLVYTLRRYIPVSAAKSKLRSSSNWLYLRLRSVLRYMVAATPTKAALKIQLEEEKAANICVICMDRRKDVIVLECRHLVMCSICAMTIVQSSGECPICRQLIVDILPVYSN